MVNHGISTGALFLLVGMIYERRHTREIAELSGLQKVAPIFAGVFTVVMLSSIGLPGLNGFVGEFLVLIGSFLTARWWAVVAATGVILAALYLLWAYQRVFHGEPDDANATFPELNLSEGLVMLPLVGLIVFLGVYPKPVLDRIEPSRRQADRARRGTTSDYQRAEPWRRGGGGTMIARPRPGHSHLPAGPSVDWFALTPAAHPRRRRRCAAHGRRRARCRAAGRAAPTPCARRSRSPPAALLDRRRALAPTCRTTGPTSLIGGRARARRVRRCSSPSSSASPSILGALFADDYLRRERPRRLPRSTSCCCSRRPAAIVMASANDLIVLFLGLETLSIALYVLAASDLRRTRVAGGGAQVLRARRLLVGVLPLRHRPRLRRHRLHQPRRRSSTFLERQRAARRTGCCSPAWRCCSSASASRWRPCRSTCWTPDVYQGAPTPVTGFMASAAKAAAFAALLRVFVVAFATYRDDWQPGRSACSPCSRWSSARCWRSCRPT